MTRNEVFDALTAMGAAVAEVHYSGGNDDGGAEDIFLRDQNGSLLSEGFPSYVDEWKYDPETHRSERRKDLSDKERLQLALEAPVHERWGSFAGEFYVSGKIIWDVAARTVIDSYDERTCSQHDEDC